MKNLKFLSSAFCAAMLTCGLTFTSCGSDSNQITKSDIEDAIENLPIMGDSAFVRYIRTGYFEVERYDYVLINRMMQAELVTATFEIKKQNTYYYKNYKKVDVVKNHIFANVSLTEKGQKYVVSGDSKFVREDYKDIYEKLYPENEKELEKEYIESLPEYMRIPDNVTAYYDNAINNNEAKEDIEENTSVVVPEPTDYNDDGEELDEYEKALKNEDVKRVKVLCGKFEIDEIFNIESTEEMQKEGIAKCLFIIRPADLTPFGIILDFKDKEYHPLQIDLKKYVDRGWVVTDMKDSPIRSTLEFNS